MIERLAPLKVDAFIDRTHGRDLFDTSFLFARYPGSVFNKQLVAIDAKLAELGGDGLLAFMVGDDSVQAHGLDRITLDSATLGTWVRHSHGLPPLPRFLRCIELVQCVDAHLHLMR